MKEKTWGEFEIIRHLFSDIPSSLPRDVVAGIGDDAAVLNIPKNGPTLITHDMLVEDIHFRSSWMSPFSLARKLTKINVSDIAAMGGIPTYALLSIALPTPLPSGWLEGFSKGLRKTFNEYNLSLIGGDTSLSPGPIVVALTLMGTCRPEAPLMRHSPNPHDTLYVTGPIGDAALGLAILNKANDILRGGEEISYLTQRHLNPTPRLEIAQILATNQLATSMIDISDGLIGDLVHLLEETNMGARLYLEKIPLSPAFLHLSQKIHPSPEDLVLSGGEDYELLFTSPYEPQYLGLHYPAIASQVTGIGEITEEPGIKVLKNGVPLNLKINGYRHIFQEKGSS